MIILEIVEFFRGLLDPEEVFFQTVLVNSKKFTLVPEGTHYSDFSKSRNNHPKVLGVTDRPCWAVGRIGAENLTLPRIPKCLISSIVP